MTDLTQITTPFGLLDAETQKALREWPHGWDVYGCFREDDWEQIDEGFCGYRTYRARPAPLVPDSIDWQHVAPEVKFMARDKHDGFSHFFEQKPYASGNMWRIDEGNTLGITRAFASYKRGTVHWKDSLVCRPGAQA